VAGGIGQFLGLLGKKKVLWVWVSCVSCEKGKTENESLCQKSFFLFLSSFFFPVFLL